MKLLPKRKSYRSIWHELGDFFRIATIFCSLMVLVSSCFVPLSPSTYFLLISQSLIVIAILFRGLSRATRYSAIGGAVCVIIVLCWSRQSTLHNNPHVTSASYPTPRAVSLVNSFFKEEDGIRLSFRILSLIGGMTTIEYAGVQEALTQQYDLLRKLYGDFPTALPATFLFSQSSISYDVLSISPIQQDTPEKNAERTVIFLHGVGGNWSLLCGILAQTFGPFGFTTVCPSTNPLGTWGSDSGEAVVRGIIQRLKNAGVKEIYLAGISSGAVGAVSLAEKFREDLHGLLLISGVAPGVSKMPFRTLLITGRGDERFTPGIVNWVLKQERGDQKNFQQKWIEGDHLAIVKHANEIQTVIREWLTHDAGTLPVPDTSY